MTLSGMFKRHFSSLAIAAFASIAAGHSAAAVVITDLTAYGAANSLGLAINNLGQVTGGAILDGWQFPRAFLYSNGQMRLLDPEHIGSGMGINDAGQVAGGVFTNVNGGLQAFVYDGNVLRTITPYDEKTSIANGINAQGQVVGGMEANPSTGVSFIYHAESGLTPLSGFQQSSGANDINGSGTVVGTISMPNVGYHGFVLSNGVVTDIGTFGGLFSEARAINEVGQVTGVSNTASSNGRAYIYENGVMKDIGTLGVNSEGFDINLGGDVVGSFYDADFNPRAFLYTEAWGMVDLNGFLDPDSGWVLQKARGINDGRTIVGIGTLDGQERVFMLSGELTMVPEPSTTLLLVIGGIAMAVQTRRRLA